jgi:hypothetical protein
MSSHGGGTQSVPNIHIVILLSAGSHGPGDTGVQLLPMHDARLTTCLNQLLHRGETDARWSDDERGLIH